TPAKLSFASRPTRSPTTEQSNSTCPDAYLLLLDRSIDGRAHTGKNSSPDSRNDIAISFEFRKGTRGDEDCKDDRGVTWLLRDVMQISVPCRHPTLCVTIEDTQMRFWFTWRATTLVTKPFNFF
ncbi:hypothetical protein EDD15DRAFT_2142690, partial [Pisolithus albus]